MKPSVISIDEKEEANPGSLFTRWACVAGGGGGIGVGRCVEVHNIIHITSIFNEHKVI
jgi:hypothetical protein